MMRWTQYLSRSVSVTTGWGANTKPPGLRTTWSATWRAAGRYFRGRGSGMGGDSPELSKPPSLGGGAGDSRGGRGAKAGGRGVGGAYSGVVGRGGGGGRGV